ncbi:MAG: type II toxin-antitoxin system prevent-host-death family antitoxin [Propionibacteriaceae bacterium]|jgi:prevent-host-death family protein|nr:type II toxin-antitoxin system prevent-host-death family antitoxin [Propionibacteriaceae bacterium]
MTERLIGIRELQREASRVVRSVEEDGAAYRVTVQGRPTRAVLGAAQPPPPGASPARVRASDLYQGITAETATFWTAEIDAARAAEGRPGDRS